MTQKIKTHLCRVFDSSSIVKNGKSRLGQRQYHCKDCGTYRVLEPKRLLKKDITAYQERVSMRDIERIFSVSRQIERRPANTYGSAFLFPIEDV